MFIALGIPVSELGLLLGLFPLAADGLFPFDGSVTDILKEPGYVILMIHAVTTFVVVFLAFGTGLAFTDIVLVTRGYAAIVAATLLAIGGAVFELFVREQ